ncbi:hypothetical protein [Gracilimonas mengyeensis]|uniref:DKNYY family protein n=1 Tax=Gracilimonas mengyeensis TaxID=1302730 RepID=A0A521D4U0_9BACT|nr:hypothetical protein [Gracilimonas mengyeensis]SMO66687.1 hypothetical protein SAMN06265219_107109 [Gracilimonas mengyeensis]
MRYVTLSLLAIFSITACSTDSNSDQPSPPIPLAIGNSWVFDIETDDELKTDTLTVIGDTLIGATTWYELHSKNPRIQDFFGGYAANLEQGYYKYRGAETASDNLLLFKTEPDQNETRYIDTGKAAWLNIYEGEDANETFNVVANRYSVVYDYVISGERRFKFDQEYEFNRLISPELGFIHWQGAYFRTEDDSTLTLSSYINVDLQEFIPGEQQ